jgi:hypothetical protein
MSYSTVFVKFCILSVFPFLNLNGALVTLEGTEFPSGTYITDEYVASAGLRFSSGSSSVFLGQDGGRTGFYATNLSGSPSFNSPTEILFVNPSNGILTRSVSFINIVWGDGGGDLDLLRVRAFDEFGNLLTTVLDETTHWSSIDIESDGISRIIVDQQPGAPFSSDTFIDSITIRSIPEPSSFCFFAISCCVTLLGRRRI